ncbi:MAG: hypothetical protein ACOX2H_01555 [Saccharofermentanales bacterium]|jgi:hypothetical protein
MNFSKHKTEISIILLILSMLLIFSSCQKLTSIVRSSNAKPILKTITVSETNESEPVYSMVFENGKIKPIQKFTPDDAKYYKVEMIGYRSELKDDEIIGSYEAIYLIDNNGNTVDLDIDLDEFIKLVLDTTKKNIWRIRIIEVDQEYFAFVKLNVNWQSPGILYKYNKEESKLEKIYSWNEVDLIGLALIDNN